MFKKTTTAFIMEKLEEYENALQDHSKRIKMIEEDNDGIKQTFTDLKEDIGLKHNELLSLINRVLEKNVALTATKTEANQIVAVKKNLMQFSGSILYIIFGAIAAVVVQILFGS